MSFLPAIHRFIGMATCTEIISENHEKIISLRLLWVIKKKQIQTLWNICFNSMTQNFKHSSMSEEKNMRAGYILTIVQDVPEKNN